jgi:hypothetical protein
MDLTFFDLRHRIVFVDYPLACHGFFLTGTLNSFLHSNHTRDLSTTSKNFHKVGLVPRLIHKPEDLKQNLNDVMINHDMSEFPGDDIIFWPIHYSATSQFRQGIECFPVVEIYINPFSWYRQFVNWWFNVGKTPKESILNTDFFIKNFNAICSEINMEIFDDPMQGPLVYNPDTHEFTLEEVIDIIETRILCAHNYEYNLESCIGLTRLQQSPSQRVYSIELMTMYNKTEFVNAVRNVFEFVDRPVPDSKKIEFLWESFIKQQIQFDEIKQHPIQLAYNSFVNRCIKKNG